MLGTIVELGPVGADQEGPLGGRSGGDGQGEAGHIEVDIHHLQDPKGLILGDKRFNAKIMRMVL